MKKFKITESQINQLIKEEYGKMMKKKALQKEISKVDAQMKAINEGNIEEVEASGTKTTKSAGWSGTDGDQKYGEKFEPKNAGAEYATHLKEDMGLDMDNDMDNDMDMDNESYESMFAAIGKMLDKKLGSEEVSDDLDNDVEDDLDNDADDLDSDAEDDLSDKDSDDEEVEEIAVVAEEEDIVNEQDGEAVANAAPQDTVNDNMYKIDNKNTEADKVYEGTETDGGIVGTPNGFTSEETEVVSEGTKTSKEIITEAGNKTGNILTEGLSSDRASALDKELARMAKYAKI